MRTMRAGTETTMGYSGADAQLMYLNRLPDYYVTKIWHTVWDGRKVLE